MNINRLVKTTALAAVFAASATLGAAEKEESHAAQPAHEDVAQVVAEEEGVVIDEQKSARGEPESAAGHRAAMVVDEAKAP